MTTDYRTERAAKAAQRLAVHWGHQPWSDPWAELVAKTILEAADGPETDEERREDERYHMGYYDPDPK